MKPDTYIANGGGGVFSSEYSNSFCTVCVTHLLYEHKHTLNLQSLVPYLKVKLDHLFLTFQEEDDSVSISWHRGDGGVSLSKYMFFKVYPYLSALWQVGGIDVDLLLKSFLGADQSMQLCPYYVTMGIQIL